MAEDYELVTKVIVEESMIRKIGDNQYLKIIPNEKNVQISTIEQTKITEPIKQSDEIIINAYPKEVKLYKNQSQDNKYETKWETEEGKVFDIPLSDIKTIFSLLQAKGLITDNMLNLSNVLSMIIKQNTLKEQIESIKEEI
ncbi:MAG: hypothetical protein BZ136_03565 [Methanosphaera sp. rholeuAM74]|nr:MAG: hypothetical protein BZ136_03565 [Methanosphaera sp. rholeuAM74]